MSTTVVQAGLAKDLAINTMRAINPGDMEILVTNIGENFFAFHNKCTHRGCRPTNGRISGGNIVCPYRGSTFDLKTAAVVKGPAKEPEPSYPVKVVEGALQIELLPR
jgi:nitrite reductase/ring-hydroxylating ferredoxin subunit